MSITVEDIQNQGFEHSLRGYDVQQVDEFLEVVAKGVEELHSRMAKAESDAVAAKAAAAAAAQQAEEAQAAAQIQAGAARDFLPPFRQPAGQSHAGRPELGPVGQPLVLEIAGIVGHGIPELLQVGGARQTP